ncbi:hypothetical protein [Citrobacter freundii]|uniref:hypothetical protein n=1 Tax=Citrobacter freundii TaxID=546 RepID=UPI003F95B0CB
MDKFTKEQQVQAVYDLKVGYTLGHADIAMLKSMARQLLASMEQEPVAYMHHSGQVVTRGECCDDKIFAICCKVETPLYAAPQLPQPAPEALKCLRSIVADPKTLPRRKEWISGQQYSYVLLESVQAMVDEACRAAMLQAGNSPVIPDAYDIKAFGIFSATEGENGLMMEVDRFHFETDSCPQVGKDKFVPKFAIQAIINRLQKHCDNMEADALVDVLSTSSAPQQEVKP